jgi:hypothetical protein
MNTRTRLTPLSLGCLRVQQLGGAREALRALRAAPALPRTGRKTKKQKRKRHADVMKTSPNAAAPNTPKPFFLFENLPAGVFAAAD